MKKKSLLILPLTLLTLTGCDNSSSKITSENSPFISEIFVSSNVFNSCLEVTNKDEIKEDIYLNFYKDKDLLLTRNLKEDFSGSKNKSIVYLNPSFKEDLSNVESKTLDSDVIYGFNYIEIVNSQNEVLDSVGTKGYSNPYIEKGSLIRNENSLYGIPIFSSLSWYKVGQGNTKYLGNTNTPLKYEDFIKGPELMESYLSLDFAKDNKACGGVYETTVSSYGDGDTTNFTFSGIDGLEEVERTRYYLVNTPEIDHTSEGSAIVEQPWGVAAMNYTNNILKNAKHILIQSAYGSGAQLRETYKRLLGFVWYTYEDNPKASDYKLLNYELVYEAYGAFMAGSTLDDMLSNEIPYYYYFNYASDFAKSKGIKIHGEKDPNFNY